MEKCNIRKIEDNILFLEKDEKDYKLNIGFIDFKIEENDELYLDNKLFEDIKNTMSSFGKIDSSYGRDLTKLEKNELLEEIIIIKRNDEEFILKRLYG